MALTEPCEAKNKGSKLEGWMLELATEISVPRVTNFDKTDILETTLKEDEIERFLRAAQCNFQDRDGVLHFDRKKDADRSRAKDSRRCRRQKYKSLWIGSTGRAAGQVFKAECQLTFSVKLRPRTAGNNEQFGALSKVAYTACRFQSGSGPHPAHAYNVPCNYYYTSYPLVERTAEKWTQPAVPISSPGRSEVGRETQRANMLDNSFAGTLVQTDVRSGSAHPYPNGAQYLQAHYVTPKGTQRMPSTRKLVREQALSGRRRATTALYGQYSQADQSSGYPLTGPPTVLPPPGLWQSSGMTGSGSFQAQLSSGGSLHRTTYAQQPFHNQALGMAGGAQYYLGANTTPRMPESVHYAEEDWSSTRPTASYESGGIIGEDTTDN